MASPIRILELCAELAHIGVDLGADAGGAEGCGEPNGVPTAGVVEDGDEHGNRAPSLVHEAQLLHGGEQPIDPKGAADARQPLFRVQRGEVVVTPAAATAADVGKVIEERLEHHAGVVVEAASDRHVDHDTARLDTRGVDGSNDVRQGGDACFARRASLHE